jgi:dual specificity phosphatase 12
MSIDIDDMEEEDLLVHMSAAVRFIDNGLHPARREPSALEEEQEEPRTAARGDDGAEVPTPSAAPRAVYVHCAMGKSRSVSCVIAYLLYKYPHRFGGKQFNFSAATTAARRESAQAAVEGALEWVQQTREIAEPNPGFMRQLELWWEMGCPVDSDTAVENHPIYQKWLYDNKLREARDLGMAPEAEWIRFVDETQPNGEAESEQEQQGPPEKQLRCKKCRRVLANSQFVVDHQVTGAQGNAAAPCPHIFIETLSWMKPALENGVLDGRLNCPNAKCNASVGRFAWQGFKCSCGEWVCPAFSLHRSRVDEVDVRAAGVTIRSPPVRNGSL